MRLLAALAFLIVAYAYDNQRLLERLNRIEEFDNLLVDIRESGDAAQEEKRDIEWKWSDLERRAEGTTEELMTEEATTEEVTNVMDTTQMDTTGVTETPDPDHMDEKKNALHALTMVCLYREIRASMSPEKRGLMKKFQKIHERYPGGDYPTASPERVEDLFDDLCGGLEKFVKDSYPSMFKDAKKKYLGTWILYRTTF